MAKAAKAVTVPDEEPKVPGTPSFGMSEGTREEIERTGKSVDPFTGRTLTKDDLK